MLAELAENHEGDADQFGALAGQLDIDVDETGAAVACSVVDDGAWNAGSVNTCEADEGGRARRATCAGVVGGT